MHNFEAKEREREGWRNRENFRKLGVCHCREREREKIRKKIEKVGEKREDILEGEMGEKPK
jgi:hypothetical protein